MRSSDPGISAAANPLKATRGVSENRVLLNFEPD
jgi:hypothetical protein